MRDIDTIDAYDNIDHFSKKSIEKRAEVLISHYKVIFSSPGDWTFQWDHAKSRAGSCSDKKRIISLSLPIAKGRDVKRTINTLLHEIAHAIAGVRHGHDEFWRAIAIKIGCDGERCFNEDEVDSRLSKYISTCPRCGRNHYGHRLRKRQSWCKCTGRTFRPDERLVWSLNPLYDAA